jgi:hypothetical protein
VLTDPGLRSPAHEQARHDAVRTVAEESFGNLLDRACFTRIAGYSGEKITVLGDTIDGDLATVA